MNHTLYQDLQSFYNQQAHKFSGTRKRHRPEFDHIIQSIGLSEAKDILELGCGDGRLYGVLRDAGIKLRSFCGVDFSAGLIDIAEQSYPNVQRQVQDMIVGLEKLNSESMDVIIAVASFQHLQNKELRAAYLDQCYRVLRYDGKIIMTNWSFSQWFISRFWKQLWQSWVKSFTDPRWMSNDILVPRYTQDRSKVHHRYYHIFRLHELEHLFDAAGFLRETSGFVMKDGRLAHRWWDARNSLMIGVKKIFV